MKIKLLCLLIIIMNCISCNDDDITPSTIPSDLTDMAYSGSLFMDYEKNGDRYKLLFETGTIEMSDNTISEINIDKDNWKSTIYFNDGSKFELPTLGNTLTNIVKKVTLNPSGFCPLAVELQLSFPVPGRVKAIVEGKNGDQGDISYLFHENASNQVINVLGLYQDYANKITIVLTDKDGKERARTVQEVTTEPFTFHALKISLDKAVPQEMEEGLTLVSYLGVSEFDTYCPFMLDADGELRWVLDFKKHPDIPNISAHTGFQRMKNGNYLGGDIKTGRIIELDVLGNVKNSWDLNALGYEYHHEVIEMPNENFLVLASGKNSKLETGQLSVSDIIIELNRKTGAIVTVWDLKKSLDETHRSLIDESDWDPADWAHNNAVLYSEDDDCIVVSTRFQGLMKLDRNNNIKWLLAPHKGWDKKGLAGALLTPLDASGNKITDNKVKSGEITHSDFEWSWGGHSPRFLPNGNILMFDNGYYRNYQTGYVENFFDPELYSRSVEYKINESSKTVQQVWQYGKERKRECWAIAVSSTQYLSGKDHVLFCPGIGTINKGGMGGKVIEVNKATNQVVYEVSLTAPTVLVFHRAIRLPLYPNNYQN